MQQENVRKKIYERTTSIFRNKKLISKVNKAKADKERTIDDYARKY